MHARKRPLAKHLTAPIPCSHWQDCWLHHHHAVTKAESALHQLYFIQPALLLVTSVLIVQEGCLKP